ncbi:MAG: hypothetical protein E7102_06290 [Prevotella ruminicola]|jgi:hypothetical protein|uniref:Uncharacterized protein n=1 Tax=Xylanibacter ruminicola TaxID=839 RepID=A0A928GII7_XYLRU|nr:hypothetical protein [Xylanibacter ruminicola]
MKKKSIIILCSVAAVCAIGLITSHFVDWPVNSNDTSGDIAKAARFSREQASEKLSNMEELLKTDSAFKDGIVAAQVVMQTRAAQFGTLVDLSNEVAGNIPAFAEVLKEMNANREVVNNVTNSLVESADNLNAALGGEECPDLAQTTINASLAYTTLQKQNKLATRFIEVTDKYLETAQGNDQLKFVRDQWLEYQQMTAALEGDKASAEALAKKGNLLSGEKALAAVSKCYLNAKMNILQSANLAQSMNTPTQLGSAIPQQTLERICSVYRNAAEVTMVNMAAEGALQSNQVEKIFNNALDEAMKNTSADAIASMQKLGLDNVQKMASTQKEVLGLKKRGPVVFSSTVKMIGSASNVMEAYQNMIGSVANNVAQSQSQNLNLGQSINNVISQTAAVANSEIIAGKFDIVPPNIK